jgi:hypothetical protein
MFDRFGVLALGAFVKETRHACKFTFCSIERLQQSGSKAMQVLIARVVCVGVATELIFR